MGVMLTTPREKLACFNSGKEILGLVYTSRAKGRGSEKQEVEQFTILESVLQNKKGHFIRGCDGGGFPTGISSGKKQTKHDYQGEDPDRESFVQPDCCACLTGKNKQKERPLASVERLHALQKG